MRVTIPFADGATSAGPMEKAVATLVGDPKKVFEASYAQIH